MLSRILSWLRLLATTGSAWRVVPAPPAPSHQLVLLAAMELHWHRHWNSSTVSYVHVTRCSLRKSELFVSYLSVQVAGVHLKSLRYIKHSTAALTHDIKVYSRNNKMEKESNWFELVFWDHLIHMVMLDIFPPWLAKSSSRGVERK